MPRKTPPRYAKENMRRRLLRRSGKKKNPSALAQSGVIPYRLTETGAELLLVTSRNGRRWIFPKGIIETGLNARDSAAKEAWEEGGVIGPVGDELLGYYEYEKWGGVCRVEMYAMRVDAVAEQWDERELRQRRWATLDEARGQIAERGLQEVLEAFATYLDRIGGAHVG